MSKWRIHRLKINNFKVFSDYDEQYSKHLVIYDGPNGFGKTSLFDAKQLLFCNKLPRVSARISALKTVGHANKSFTKNLYRHHYSDKDISIKAEFKNGSDSFSVMRLARASDIDSSTNKPSDFDSFRLYLLQNIDDEKNATLIEDENTFWTNKFGENFLNNFSVLNYLQQDSKSIIIPDECDKRSRFGQIEHLLNLDKIKARIDRTIQLKDESKRQLTQLDKTVIDDEASIKQCEKNILSENGRLDLFFRITNSNQVPFWDSQTPFNEHNSAQIHKALSDIDILKEACAYKEEISKHLRNKGKIEFLKRSEFELAIRLYHHIDKYDEINSKSKRISKLENILKLTAIEPIEITISQATNLQPYLPEIDSHLIIFCIKERNILQQRLGELTTTNSELLQIRKKLISLTSDIDTNCPMCGFDYKERKLLTSSILDKTNKIEMMMSDIDKEMNAFLSLINLITTEAKNAHSIELSNERKNFNSSLYKELSQKIHQSNRLKTIGDRISSLGIELPTLYPRDNFESDRLTSEIKEKIMLSLEKESGVINESHVSILKTCYLNMAEFDLVTIEDIESKRNYIINQYNLSINSFINKKRDELNHKKTKLSILEKTHRNLRNIESKLKSAQTDYMNKTISQMESLFHIYTGRLLQNYQSGLGVFIDVPSKAKQNAVMNFKTAKDSQHDATLSMSSGQISALSLSLFLSLNKKYAKTAFAFVDDPTQCMDEINIASLSDLLRIEFRERQVIISTHEQDISDYLYYRYGKAGLERKQINLLKTTKANN